MINTGFLTDGMPVDSAWLTNSGSLEVLMMCLTVSVSSQELTDSHCDPCFPLEHIC